MNILMLTNTFAPYVGGVARSVQAYADAYRRRGHRVQIGAPRYRQGIPGETEVIRFPAIQHFNGSDWSLPIPVPGQLARVLADFQPDLVHAHHPFVLGGTALRVATAWGIPAVFTHHTMYEKYTHYMPGDSERLKRYVVRLVSGYCNLTDAVIAPSETLAGLLAARGVRTPVTVIPTGVDTATLAAGDGAAFRAVHGIPAGAFVVGHVGRLAPEKNLDFLTQSVCRFLAARPDAYFLLVGIGVADQGIRAAFAAAGLATRLREVGLLHQPQLACAYRAMDCFAFASHTETQGLVLAEAMAAGVPVVAVDASGVREVVVDGHNGCLLPGDDPAAFAAALAGIAALAPAARAQWEGAARDTAAGFDIQHTADRALALYEGVIVARARRRIPPVNLTQRLKTEFHIARNIAHAAASIVLP
jgi:glycosyltransferase involved in cell wall biosynthesis